MRRTKRFSPFCEKQVRLGNMTQSEADEIIARHSGK